MFATQVLLAAVVTVIRFPSVTSFQSGSDYDIYDTTNLYNCSGSVPISNVTIPNALDTLPQIEPSAGYGWEQWSLFLHGTFPMIMRWSQGDPSSCESSPAHFDILADINGTVVQDTTVGELSYTNDGDIKQIAIGNNSLVWDSDASWYNVSVSMDGYQLELDSLSAMLGAFHPSVGLYDGLLDPSGDLFSSVPLIRGHAVGSLYTPLGQNITIDGLSVIRHIFSENPLPFYINKYSGGALWGHSNILYDTHVFYRTETTDGTAHEAAFLGRAIPAPDREGVFSSAWATYAVTDDPNLYSLSIDVATNNINASFSGCSNSNDVPYLFNISTLTLLGKFTDLGGGTMSYYHVNGTTTASFNGVVMHGMVAGIFEEYQALSMDIGMLSF